MFSEALQSYSRCIVRVIFLASPSGKTATKLGELRAKLGNIFERPY
jgi:hypothetical protein